MKVTINDIAKNCGVSSATVSNALNGTGRVSVSEQKRIVETAAEMGYARNSAARMLAKRTSGLIGLFATDTDYLKKSIFFSSLVSELTKFFNQYNYGLLVATCGSNGNLLRANVDVDAIVVINPDNSPEFNHAVLESKVPVVIIGRPFKDEESINYVDVDNVSIAYNMTKLLLEKGHRNVAMLCGPEDYTVTQDQLQGYRLALEEFGLPFDSELLNFSEYFLDDNVDAFFNLVQKTKCTAIVAASDNLAVSAVSMLHKMRLNVPKDISVVCLAGTFFSEFYSPKITGVKTVADKIGKAVSDKVIKLINKKLIRPTHTIVSYSVFEGESVAKKI